MVKLLLLSFILIMTSCASFDKTPVYKPDTCFVSWRFKEDQRKYHDGKGLTRSEKSKKGILIPLFANTMFVILNDEGENYTVHGYVSLEEYELMKNNLEKYLILEEYEEKQLMKIYIHSKKKISKKSMDGKIRSEKYEQVDCQEYHESVYL